jgi:hypothetical protein
MSDTLMEQVQSHFDGYPYEDPVQMPSGAWKWSIEADGDVIWVMLVTENPTVQTAEEFNALHEEYGMDNHEFFMVIPPHIVPIPNFPQWIWRGETIKTEWLPVCQMISERAEEDTSMAEVATELLLRFGIDTFAPPWELVFK